MEFSLEKIAELCQTSNYRKIDFYLAINLSKKETNPIYQNSIFLVSLLISNRLIYGAIFLNEEQYLQGYDEFKKLIPKKTIEILNFQELNQTKTIGDSNSQKPLIYNSAKIYFNKFFNFQEKIFQQLELRILNNSRFNNLNNFEDCQLNLKQLEAVCKSATLPLTVISGGPGTGKTFVIAKLINFLKKTTQNNIKVAVVTLTGKAARRIEESCQWIELTKIGNNFFTTGNILFRISTIHSMLNQKNSYYYNQEEQFFLWDYLIVDESSMIDIALLYKLLTKTHHKTKISFVGDSRQLNPINAGYFFFDFCQSLQKTKPYFFVDLQENYRIKIKKADSNVAELSKLLSLGKKTEFLHFLEQKKEYFHQLNNIEEFYNFLLDLAVTRWYSLFTATTPEVAFNSYQKFIILCALKISLYGSDKINGYIEQQLWLKKLINSSTKDNKFNQWYNGKPIMILVNSLDLGVYNGDIGICLKDEQEDFKIYFQNNNDYFTIHPSKLPKYQTAYAFSIHKSQGSEFEEVVICLSDKSYDFFNLELLYTAITRAKNKATICANLDIIKQTIEKNCQPTTAFEQKFTQLLTSGK